MEAAMSTTENSIRADHTRARCRVAAGGLSDTRFQGEIGSLLHRRLRTVTLIALLPLSLFFLRNLLEGVHVAAIGRLGLALQGVLCVFLACIAVALFLRPRFPLDTLRQVELAQLLS